MARRRKNHRSQRPGNRSHAYTTYGNVHDKDGNPQRFASDTTSFSLRDEARNTERHHTWNSDSKLWHNQVSFVSAGSAEPEASKTLHASTPQVTHNVVSHLSPPQPSLASLEISERRELPPGVGPPDQRLGAITSTVGPVRRLPENDQHRRRPVASMCFLDNIASSIAIKKDHASPKLPRPVSPSPSSSSEEIIVFEGRKGGPQKSCKPQNEMLGTPSISIHESYISPGANGKLISASIGTVDSLYAISTTPGFSQRPVHKNPKDLGSGLSMLDFKDAAGDEMSKSIRRSHKGKRRKHVSKQKLFQSAKEDEIFADYIENMDQNEVGDHGAFFRKLVGDDNVLSESSTATESSNNGMGDTKERNTKLPRSGRAMNGGCAVDENTVLYAYTDEESNESIQHAELAADLQDNMDNMEDEHDLLARNQASMTDERIARLLAKQEELGLSSNELLLFDGDEDQSSENDDVVFQSAATKHRRQGKKKQRYQSTDAFPAATELADMFDQDPYGDFDVMDHDRPSLKSSPRSRRNAPVLDISDIELEASLQLAWQKDRSNKKIKKREREELRVQGLLGTNGQADFKIKYWEGISFRDIRDELTEFMISARQSLRLKSKSSGQGKARFPVLHKSARTGDFDEASIRQLLSLSTSNSFFPRKDVKGQGRAAGLRPGRRNAANTAGVSYQDGEVVGAAAPEIGEENRGRAMLEKMGWSRGMGLGALNNKGMLQPVAHTVKISKAGLG
ncbi:MAG: hypothetical protein Q9207_006742 [Kuettlingeria erythrocarpa]